MNFSREENDMDSTQKLDGIDNYTAWAVQIWTILRKKKCFAGVKPNIALPKLLHTLEIS